MNSRRLRIALGVVIIALLSCATVPPEQAAREALMWEAARECKARFVTIQSIDRIDNFGRLVFTYHGSGPEIRPSWTATGT